MVFGSFDLDTLGGEDVVGVDGEGDEGGNKGREKNGKHEPVIIGQNNFELRGHFDRGYIS